MTQSDLIRYICVNPRLQFGAKSTGNAAERIRLSPNFKDGKFRNPEKTVITKSVSFSMFGYFLKGNTVPDGPIPVVTRTPAEFDGRATEPARITWFGHSTALLELDGKKILIDPMLSNVTGPHPLIGSKRFNAELPLTLEQFPDLDAVIVSHDHYDHFDYETIRAIKANVKRFFVPLGVGAHLASWDVERLKITELDWWEEITFDGITLASTPARHFSGRGGLDTYRTLWCSWVIKGNGGAIFFGGDSGYTADYKKIGAAYGPFDIALLECGQYNEQWPEIHMMPEETVRANIDLQSRLLLPIHWGAFKIALHRWNEPVERLLEEAVRLNVKVTTPRIGEFVIPGVSEPASRWWRQ